MSNSIISLIIPTFNRKYMLGEALAGLFEDNGSSFECIIVDDASTDGTCDIVDEWRRKWGDERIVYLRQKDNMGAQSARNWGIKEAKGKFLLFMDSDDVPEPKAILCLRNRLESNPELDYCYGKVQQTNAALKPTGSDGVVGSPFDDIPREIAGYHWHTMGALYRRECVERVGLWNPELTGSQDWEYQARVKLFGGKGAFVDKVVGYWRQHEGERVGASIFRPDYVRSVMLACASILSHSRKAGRCDKELECRIAKKLLVHALEWGANGYADERKACLRQAERSFRERGGFARLMRYLAFSPPFLDALILKFIIKFR